MSFASSAKSNRELKNLSRGLSTVLRHKAVSYKVPVRPDGYAKLDDVLRVGFIQRMNPTYDDIAQIVATCDKQRFRLSEDADGTRLIRANQGHTMKHIDSDLLLTRVTDPTSVPVSVHGTKKNVYELILRNGLSRMKRNHVHFAPGLPDDGAVISGMRTTSDIYVYVDVKAAMSIGLVFYKSTNEVILCAGDARGLIPPTVFDKIVSSTGKVLYTGTNGSGIAVTTKADSTSSIRRNSKTKAPMPPSNNTSNVAGNNVPSSIEQIPVVPQASINQEQTSLDKEYSAGIVVFRRRTGLDELEALVVQRCGRADYEIPKGHLEGAESNIEAAMRELKEETGLITRVRAVDTSYPATLPPRSSNNTTKANHINNNSTRSKSNHHNGGSNKTGNNIKGKGAAVSTASGASSTNIEPALIDTYNVSGRRGRPPSFKTVKYFVGVIANENDMATFGISEADTTGVGWLTEAEMQSVSWRKSHKTHMESIFAKANEWISYRDP